MTGAVSLEALYGLREYLATATNIGDELSCNLTSSLLNQKLQHFELSHLIRF